MGKRDFGKGVCLLIAINICLFITTSRGEETLKPCYHEDLLECPPNALCSRFDISNPLDLKCICLQHFQFNSKWQEIQNFTNNKNSSTDKSSLELEENYCLPAVALDHKENKIVVYMQSAANPQHLIFGIVLVLFVATLATSLLYGLKVLRPWKRTKAVYKRLTNRRQNITPLHEMDELELNRRYEMETF